MPEFISGLELARGFYDDVVRPLIDRPHTACLIGEGSEVLGYDTERSTDHEWGPRLQLFTAAEDVSRIAELIEEGLPRQYRGHATSWFSLVQGGDSHHLEISTLDDWLTRRLPTIPRSTPDSAAWLAIPQQHLLQLTAGEMFRDDDGRLGRLREEYRWYPIDVWRWIVASQWHLIGNTTPLLGRTAELGDLRGARLIMGTLCRLIMELAFLQERRFRPYAKWFGRAFEELAAAASLGPLIDRALAEPPTVGPTIRCTKRCCSWVGGTTGWRCPSPSDRPSSSSTSASTGRPGPIRCSTPVPMSMPRSRPSPIRHYATCLGSAPLINSPTPTTS